MICGERYLKVIVVCLSYFLFFALIFDLRQLLLFKPMVNILFPDFLWFTNIKKKKVSIDRAVQIQYLVEKGKDGEVWVHAINIFKRGKDQRSGDPLSFNIQDYPLLKACTMKQWVLALTWEGCVGKLPSKSVSLLGGYLLYYEKILDEVMESEDVENLKKWLDIEYNSGGRHMDDVENGSGDCIGEMEKIGAVLKLWNMGTLYEMTDPREMDGNTKEEILGAVEKWLLDQCDKNEESDIIFQSLRSTKWKGKEKEHDIHFTGRILFQFSDLSIENFNLDDSSGKVNYDRESKGSEVEVGKSQFLSLILFYRLIPQKFLKKRT